MRVSGTHSARRSVDRAPARRMRARLAFTSALGGLFGGLMGSPLAAQTLPPPRLPTPNDVVGSNPDGLITAPDVRSGNGRLDVTLNARNTVIDWRGFNIPEGNRADFAAGLLVRNVPVAVLNRDVSGNVSQLLGRLTSADNVAVWVYNPNGIVVGQNAAFSTGSLVLTTLNPNEADFLAGGRDYRLTATATAGQSAITVANGAQIRVEGGNRGLVMVAPRIDASGRFEAVGQDVAFVTAADVTLNYANNGPLSVTLRQGTAVSGTSQYVRGSVAGNDALFALASQATITDALLRVDASVTTATAGTRGIVLSAGRATTPVAGISISADPADTGGVANLQVGGMLTSNDTDGSDILADATGTASFTAALSSRRDVLLGAGGLLDVAAPVAAGRAYTLTGGGIGLGPVTFGDPDLVQSAAGITMTVTNGDIVGRSGLTLRTGGSGAMTLATGGTADGDILFAPDTGLQVGADRGGVLTVRVRDVTNVVTLGDVTARSLRGAVATGPAANGLASGTALVVGDVDVRDPLSLDAAGIVAGRLQSDGAVRLVSTAGLSISAVTARGGSATLTGGGDVTVAGTIAATGTNADVTVEAPGVLALTGLVAGRDVRVGGGTTAASATVSGTVAAGRNFSVVAGTVVLGSGAPATQSANGTVAITAGPGGVAGASGLTLRSNADGSGSEALTIAIDPAAAGLGAGIAFAADTTIAGGTAQQSDIQLRSADAAGAVTLGRVSARNLFGAVGTDAFATGLFRTGPITVGAVGVRGDLLLTGAGIDTGTLASGGAVTLDGGTGRVTVGGNVDAAAAIAVRGASVSLGGARLAGGGEIDLLARTGGIASTSALAIGSTSARNADFVRLQAAGADGIVLAPGSAIVAGANRTLRTAVFNGTPGAPLALGNVAARSLGALAALDGDATQPAGAIIQPGSLTFGNLDLVDNFAAQSTAGDLSVARIAVTGTGQGIDLRAAGTLSVQNSVTASGDVTLASGTALRLGIVESRDGRASVTSNGAVRLDLLAGAQAANAQGSSLAIDVVRGGAVSLTATSGDATLGTVTGTSVAADATAGGLALTSVEATRGITLSAAGALSATGLVRTSGGALSGTAGTGAATLTGGAQATGTVTIAGRSVTLGGVQQAGGSYRARATDGGIGGGTGLTITADSDGTGGDALALIATGDVALGGGATLRGGRDGLSPVTITAGGLVETGAITAGGLDIGGVGAPLRTVRTGNLALGGDLSLVAADGVTTGTITSSGAVAIDGGSGEAAVGDVTATRAVALSGGTLRFGAVDGTSLIANAGGGDLTGGAVRVGGTATLSAAGALRTGNIGAIGAVTLAGTSLAFGNVSGSSLTAGASIGAITGGGITVGGAAEATATGTVDLGRVATSQGRVSIVSGGRMAIAEVSSGGGASLRAGGTDADILIANGLTAVDAVSVAATRHIRAPFIRSSAGDLTVSAPNGEVTGIDPNAGIGLSAGPGRAFALTVGTAARLGDIAGGRIAISATSISAGRINAGTDGIALQATNGNLVVTGPVTGGDVTFGATGRTSLADLSATGAVRLSGGSDLTFGQLAGSSITATSSGAIVGTSARATGALDLTSATLSLRGAGGQTVTARTTGAADLGTAVADGALVVATGGALTFGDIAGGTITATAGGAITGTDARASGSLDLAGAALSLRNASGQAVTARADGAADFGTVAARDALVIGGGTALTFGEASGGVITATAGGAITGSTVRGAGSVEVTGGGLSLRDVTGRAVTLRATNGDLALTALTAGSDAVLSATGAARIAGAVSAGGTYRVTGTTVALGGAGVTQRAAGEVRITATRGDIAGAAGLTLASDTDASAGAEALILDAAGGIELAGTRLQARPGGGAALGLRTGSGRAVRLGTIEAGLVGGFDGARVAGPFVHNADVSAGDVTASEMAVALSAGNLTAGKVAASGALTLRAASGTVTTGDLKSASLELASAGPLTTGTIGVGGAATLAGGSIAIGDARAAALTIRTAGALGGQNGARPSVTTTTGDLSVAAGATRVGAVASAGGIDMAGSTIDVAGRLAAARTLLVQAREALTLGEASAGGDMTLRAGGAMVAGALDTGGALVGSGADVAIGTARVGGRLALTSTRDLSLGNATAGDGAVIDATGVATLAGLAAGPAVTVTAADLVLSGPLRATSVAFATKVPAATAMRLGDGAGEDGFRLSAAEIGQVTADTLRFDAGAGAMTVGSVALAPTTGRTVDLVSTGAIRVLGELSATGAGRTIRFGGSDGANAGAIHVVATSGAGGRLMLEGVDLELRADRIAVGLGPGFIDTLGEGETGRAQAANLIGNANSALYNPQFGGGFYDPGATTTLEARSLTVRFADYALFQNTAIPGQVSGLTLGGTATAPVQPALRIAATGATAGAGFALFGTVNGIDGASAALLGNAVLDIDPLLLPNSRINGCLAGSGAGCLTTIAIQPTLQVFDFDSQEVFGISQDVAVPFAPIVGGNNEELLSELPELAPAADPNLPAAWPPPTATPAPTPTETPR